jgi:hypothetical protein
MLVHVPSLTRFALAALTRFVQFMPLVLALAAVNAAVLLWRAAPCRPVPTRN